MQWMATKSTSFNSGNVQQFWNNSKDFSSYTFQMKKQLNDRKLFAPADVDEAARKKRLEQ
jgi:hypothetical protein